MMTLVDPRGTDFFSASQGIAVPTRMLAQVAAAASQRKGSHFTLVMFFVGAALNHLNIFRASPVDREFLRDYDGHGQLMM